MMRNLLNLFSLIVIFIAALSCSRMNQSNLKEKVLIDSLQNKLTRQNEIILRQETNKKLVADFYQQLFGDKNIDAIDQYIGDIYIQHNPILPDGKDVLKKAASEWFKNAPKEKIDVQHIGADGDLVFIHTRAKFGNSVSSVIDIFRIENGKIVEHWDVIQQVPEKSANPHPMF